VVHVVAGSGVCGFSPDGRLLALTGSIWDLARGQPLEESLGGRCLGFSPDGRYVLTTQYDGTGLWDVTGSRAPTRLSEHEAWRQAWSANGRFLAFANDDRNVEVWDLESKPPTQRVLSEREKGPRGRPCRPALLLSRDGTLLSDSCLITDLWDLSRPTPRLMLRTGRVPISPPGGRAGRAGPPVLSQDGRTLVYTWGTGRRGAGNGGFGLWDVANGRPVGPRVEVRYFGRMELSPDGSLLATAGWGPDPSGNEGFILQIWSVEAIRSAAASRASATSALSQ
jgi:WD40 repeat protein